MCEALPPTLEKNTMDLGGYMSICRYIVFWHLGPYFGVLVAFWRALWCLFSTWCDLGAPLWNPGVHFVTLGTYLGGFLWIWGDLGAPLWHPWAPFGHPWGPFGCLLITFGCGPGPLWPLVGKRLEKDNENDRNWEPK